MAKNKQNSSTFVDIYRPELISPLSKANFSSKKTTKKKQLTKIIPELESYSLPIMKGSVKHVSTNRSKFKVVVRKVERPFKEDFEHQLT